MAKKSGLHLTLITPDRQVLDETVDSVVVPAHDGELGILNNRAPLMCELGIGTLRYAQGAQTKRFYVDGGFAQVLENRVVVLTSKAVAAPDITAEMIAAAEREVSAETGTDAAARDRRARGSRRAAGLKRAKATA